MKIERAKGTRDFGPKEEIVRKKIINKLMGVFEKFGFSPIDTPIIEREDLLKAKYGAGEEADVLKESFLLQDNGGRKLGLRYELTLPLARYISMNPTLKLPFKRYQIGKVFRDGPIKLGRYREFYQCDIDIIGSRSTLADAEVLSLLSAGFMELGLKVIIELNDRRILEDALALSEIENEKWGLALISVDKLKKIGAKGVIEEMYNSGISKKKSEKLLSILSGEIEKELKDSQGIKELKKLLLMLDDFDVKVKFNPTLSRGLAYYTGPIFEVFLEDSPITSSVAGGGRWDDMIGSLTGKKTFATGVSFGLEPIMEEIFRIKMSSKRTVTEILVISINSEKYAIKVVNKLRKIGIKTEIDLMSRGISKNLDYADKLGIPYVVIVGNDEENKHVVKLKEMGTGKEETLEIEKLAEKIRGK